MTLDFSIPLIDLTFYICYLVKFDSSSFILIIFVFLSLADFLPVFKLIDLATGQISQFHGNYRLTIVGGGPTYHSVTDYTEEEQMKYNYQTTR